MEIRRAEEGDIPGIDSLLFQVLSIHAKIRPDIFIPGTKKYTDGQLSAILSDERTPVFVAEEDGRLLGHLFCQIREIRGNANLVARREFFLDDLCVDEAARGRGVGRALCEYAKEYARRCGCAFVTLNVWEGNDRARRFYEAMGFGVRETQMEFPLGEDAAR